VRKSFSLSTRTEVILCRQFQSKHCYAAKRYFWVRPMNQPRSFALKPAGYLIVEDVRAVRRAFKTNYHGIDRLPKMYHADVWYKRVYENPEGSDRRLDDALLALEEVAGPNAAFIAEYSAALRLLQTFRNLNYVFELLYCDVAHAENENYVEVYPANSSHAGASLTLGFDICWPTANHSAIFQPGVVPRFSDEKPGDPHWREKLNKWGLLDDYQDATRLRDEYLAVYPYPPFDIFLVNKVEYELDP